MANDSTRGSWHCPGRVVPPSPRRVLTRAEVAGLARQEALVNTLYDMADGPSATYWQDQLAAMDAALAVSSAAA